MGPHQKLHPLCYGPYTMTKVVGDNAFELNLPLPWLAPSFQCGPPLAIFSTIIEQLGDCRTIDTNITQP